jgi:hypothetical protein
MFLPAEAGTPYGDAKLTKPPAEAGPPYLETILQFWLQKVMGIFETRGILMQI